MHGTNVRSERQCRSWIPTDFIIHIVEGVRASVLVTEFVLRWFFRFLHNPGMEKAANWETGDSIISIPKSFVDDFENDRNRVSKVLAKSYTPSALSYRMQQCVVLSLCSLSCYLLWIRSFGWSMFLWFGSVVFIPYSLGASIPYALTFLQFELPNILTTTAIQYGVVYWLPSWMQMKITCSGCLVVGYLGIKYLLSTIIYLKQQYATSKSNLLWSIVYSSQNHMPLIHVLFLFRHFESSFSLLSVILNIWIGPRVVNLFVRTSILSAAQYLQHIGAHFPGVYSESHKWHHEIRDTTPFDSGFGGVGFPELLFRSLCAFVPLALGSAPYEVSYDYWIYVIPSMAAHGHNDDSPYHWDHHMMYNVNYGDDRLSIFDIILRTFKYSLPHKHTYGYSIRSEYDEKRKEMLISIKRDPSWTVVGEPFNPALPIWLRRFLRHFVFT